MTSLPYRNSGFDFSDGPGSLQDQGYPLEKPEDRLLDSGRLQRNRTERVRLQTLMRSDSPSLASVRPTNLKLLKLKERWDHWMVNDGGRQLFFAVWIFLHFLVVLFGFMNYQLKDNLTTARSTFGMGYRESH